MEGLKIVIFALVAVVWLGIWIVRMFRSAFNQPTANQKRPVAVNPKPYNANPASLEEMIKQHRPKTEAEILERSAPRPARSLENPEPKYKSLETEKPRRQTLEKLQPLGGNRENKFGEMTTQREDIVRRRREKNVYQQPEQQPVSVFAQLLRNPENARNAVVLAEILKPKF